MNNGTYASAPTPLKVIAFALTMSSTLAVEASTLMLDVDHCMGIASTLPVVELTSTSTKRSQEEGKQSP